MAAAKSLAVTADLRMRSIRLCFHGVDYEERFYLNGELLGTRTELVAQLGSGDEATPNNVAVLPGIDLVLVDAPGQQLIFGRMPSWVRAPERVVQAIRVSV